MRDSDEESGATGATGVSFATSGADAAKKAKVGSCESRGSTELQSGAPRRAENPVIFAENSAKMGVPPDLMVLEDSPVPAAPLLAQGIRIPWARGEPRPHSNKLLIKY